MRPRRGIAWPRLSIVVLSLCAAGACARTGGSQQDAAEALPPVPLGGAGLVAGYRGWARVNPEPAVFHSRTATLCAAPPTAGQRRQEEQQNPHRDKFVTVYVNDAGRRAMLEEKSPRFPVGSLVVKEKLPARDAAEPELLTAMYKREAGYDPEGGDWEYLVLDGRGEELRARGRLETCRACHQTYPQTDFVARNYLPDDLYRKLK
jgi:hypothetical protein